MPFGEPKAMNTGAARMARVTGALVMPIQQVRLPGTAGYRVIIQPPLECFPTGDEVTDATRLIRVVEEQVRAGARALLVGAQPLSQAHGTAAEPV